MFINSGFKRLLKYPFLIAIFAVCFLVNRLPALAQVAEEQSPLDRILDQKRLEKQQEKLLKNQRDPEEPEQKYNKRKARNKRQK